MENDPVSWKAHARRIKFQFPTRHAKRPFWTKSKKPSGFPFTTLIGIHKTTASLMRFQNLLLPNCYSLSPKSHSCTMIIRSTILNIRQHVTMSVVKFLSRIVAPSEVDYEQSQNKEVCATLHGHTYGITSDPSAQFACVLSALIHDVDHPACKCWNESKKGFGQNNY